MSQNRSAMCSALACLALVSAVMAKDTEQPDYSIEKRIANFREIGTAFKYIGDELKREHPNLSSVQQSAGLIQNLGAHMLQWFPPGTAAESASSGWIEQVLAWFSSSANVPAKGATENHAKASIWTEWGAFEQAYRHFGAEADRMARAAHSDQTAAVRVQYNRLAKTCKGCHDRFREDIDQ